MSLYRSWGPLGNLRDFGGVYTEYGGLWEPPREFEETLWALRNFDATLILESLGDIGGGGTLREFIDSLGV